MRTRDLARAALFAALIAICSWLAIPTAVPFTLQTFAVFLALGVLGGKLGTLTVAVYLLLGAVGLPVFAGFQGGLGALLSGLGKRSGEFGVDLSETRVENGGVARIFGDGLFDRGVRLGLAEKLHEFRVLTQVGERRGRIDQVDIRDAENVGEAGSRLLRLFHLVQTSLEHGIISALCHA